MELKYTYNIAIAVGAKPLLGITVLVFAAEKPIDKAGLESVLYDCVARQLSTPNIDVKAACVEACREAREKFGYQVVQVPTDSCLQLSGVKPVDSPNVPTDGPSGE